MLNPNIDKRITVNVFGCIFFKYNKEAPEKDHEYLCSYKDHIFIIDNRSNKFIKPGNRHVQARYSIFNNGYYLVRL